LSNLGIQILYEKINNRYDTLAERAYAPWLDMEKIIRENNIPLFSLESKTPLQDFDILGFTLPYETLYTNTLNLLDLAKIPIHSLNRNENHPFIIAGGHATYNPEPMSIFIDAFLLGEGEEIIFDLIDVYQIWKRNHQPKEKLLFNLTQIPGIYIHFFYQPKFQLDGTMLSIETTEKKVPSIITKRIIGKLPYVPKKFIVPSIAVVHNRISIEIMRGCTRGCRFCHAGMVNRPVRERSVDEIVDGIQEAIDNTGFEEIALLSLSSSDYTNIVELVDKIGERFVGQNLVVSLPSLRIESFSVELMEKLKGTRQGGFTLAPEAATDRMRNIINKPISDEQLLSTAREIFKRGWHTIKLYFMIGHPSETLEDVEAIANLCKKVLYEGQKIIGKRANVHAGVSTFVPKPHTPFQWVACDDPETIKMKQDLLRNSLRGPGLKFNWTDTRETMLESWLSRGDRRLANVIENAWRNGAKFDAWQDMHNHQFWMDAFEQAELDPEFYTHRTRFLDEVFPWEHISIGVNKSYIMEEYQNSLSQILRNDCRAQCYACGIIQNFKDVRQVNPGNSWLCPEIKIKSRENEISI
ncbi:MAG: TIGR03960 family B12-binding radical SAM protein, partial [Anaerolineaceae bacterium]|nr:TIGR03960 family B12-binding radical SAM protein [Anaerolineaceae bacterium]